MYPLLLQFTDCEYEQKISKDLARTFPLHPLYKKHNSAAAGQQRLFNVLKAYAVLDKDLGYCQGMAFLVGVLLMKLSEETAFCVLVSVMKAEPYGMRRVYSKELGLMPLFLFTLDALTHEMEHTVWQVLYCIVLYCIVLHCIALCWIALHCIALYCIALSCIVLYCIVLYCIASCWIVLYCSISSARASRSRCSRRTGL
eukprot:SAG31_NODE_1073_length_10065_cov_2.176701_11_plen_199_part_00